MIADKTLINLIEALIKLFEFAHKESLLHARELRKLLKELKEGKS